MKIEVSAKSIEKAIEEGLKKLNTTIENVTVNVITEGGLFKKAKIEMIMDDDKDIKDEIFGLEENTNSMNAEIKDDDPSNDELVSIPVSAELETEVVYDKDKVVEVKEKLTLNVRSKTTNTDVIFFIIYTPPYINYKFSKIYCQLHFLCISIAFYAFRSYSKYKNPRFQF